MGQRRSQEGIWKIFWNKWLLKPIILIPEPTGHCKGSSEKEFYSNKCIY